MSTDTAQTNLRLSTRNFPHYEGLTVIEIHISHLKECSSKDA